MPHVSVVAHTPTASLRRLLDAVVAGLDRVDEVSCACVPALEARAGDLADNDLVVLLTPANFGYISGALKHAFDVSFRELEHVTAGHRYLAVVKGSTDTTGAVRAVESITTGMGWRAVRPPFTIEGDVTPDHETELRELLEGLATALTMDAL